MRALFYTLGCKVNQYETQAMMRCMADNGYETGEYLPGSPDAGDAVIVLNSCTVTGESDRKLRQLLRRCRRENPRAVLVLTGCLPQAFPEEAEGFAEADVVLGNAARAALPRCVNQYRELGHRIVEIPDHGKAFESLSIDAFRAGRGPLSKSRTDATASVRIVSSHGHAGGCAPSRFRSFTASSGSWRRGDTGRSYWSASI